MTMTRKEKADEFVRTFAKQLPGVFDYCEGMSCYLGGYNQGVHDAIQALLRADNGSRVDSAREWANWLYRTMEENRQTEAPKNE